MNQIQNDPVDCHGKAKSVRSNDGCLQADGLIHFVHRLKPRTTSFSQNPYTGDKQGKKQQNGFGRNPFEYQRKNQQHDEIANAAYQSLDGFFLLC